MNTDYSEDKLVAQPAIELFSEFEYETANCFYEKVGTVGSTLGLETTAEVILIPKLRRALQKLNPDLPSDAINPLIRHATGKSNGESTKLQIRITTSIHERYQTFPN